ncbi:MAG: hypothetical protein DYG99_07795 [Bacteroidetes bacterium CHB5]|nr:hypothetical protein [Bacteroidetes bacterium CHB5]
MLLLVSICLFSSIWKAGVKACNIRSGYWQPENTGSIILAVVDQPLGDQHQPVNNNIQLAQNT